MGKFDDQIDHYTKTAQQMRSDAADLKSGRWFLREEQGGKMVDISQKWAGILEQRAIELDTVVAAYKANNA